MPATASMQLTLKNILVPVDFSPQSDPAVKLARAIAQQHGSMIHLANVIESFDLSAPSSNPQHEIDVEHAIRDFGSIEKHLLGISHETVVLDGDVNVCLLRAIEEQDIDLVVMATQAAHGCERMLMGSVTEELFREAKCPVLTIGPECREDFGRFASFKTILYPMEMTPSSTAAIPYVVALVNRCGATINLLHVVHPDIQSASERQRIRERLSSEMRDLFPAGMQRSIADVIVEFGPIVETIIEFSVARRADAIVLGVRSGGAFTRSATHIPWTTAHRIIAEAPSPVLTTRSHIK